MARSHPLYFLDTNIVLAIVRGKELAEYIERHYHIRSNPFRPFISVVTLGELYAMALRNNWGNQKRAVLRRIEQELVVVDINRRDLLDAYAEVQCATGLKGKSLSKNDLWIAASVKATGSILLTTDKDFDCLHPEHIDRVWINPQKGKPQS